MNIDTIKPNSFAAWLIAIRPKTLGAVISPVLAALAITVSDGGVFHPFTATMTVLLAVLMQVISNLENDAGYTKKKAERNNRKGLPRATSLGLLSIDQVEKAIQLLAIFALVITGYFIYIAGWFFLFITIFSVIAAYLYMGGPRPIAYTPFGELTVLLFFGLVATCGTYYLQIQTLSWNIFVVSIAIGLIAAAVLCVNNFRDRIHDESIGRRTLCVILGERSSQFAYKFMIFTPYLLIASIFICDPSRYPYLITYSSLPIAIKLPQQLATLRGNDLNNCLFSTVKLEILFSLTLSIGALIHAFLPK